MKKIISFFTVLLFSVSSVFALEKSEVEDITIISRAQWGADEEIGYKDSTPWKEKLAAWADAAAKPLTEAQKLAQEKSQEKYQDKVDYINTYFPKENTITKIVPEQDGRPLAWKEQYSDYVNAIVVHHTATEYPDSWTGIKDIYQYHTLGRSWGDIGYNYVIGYNGEIFEGRK